MVDAETKNILLLGNKTNDRLDEFFNEVAVERQCEDVKTDSNHIIKLSLYPDSANREDFYEYWKTLTGEEPTSNAYHSHVDIVAIKSAADFFEPGVKTEVYNGVIRSGEESIQIKNTIDRDEEGQEFCKSSRVEKDTEKERVVIVHIEGEVRNEEYPLEEHPNAYITKDYSESRDVCLKDAEKNWDIKVYEDGNTILEQKTSIFENYDYYDIDNPCDEERGFMNEYCQNHVHEMEYAGEEIVKDKVTIESFFSRDMLNESIGAYLNGDRSRIDDIGIYQRENTYENGKIVAKEITIQEDNTSVTAICKENKTELCFQKMGDLGRGDLEKELKIGFEKHGNGEVTITETFTDIINGHELKFEDVVATIHPETGELSIDSERKTEYYNIISEANLDWPHGVEGILTFDLDIDLVNEIENIGNLESFEDRYSPLRVGLFEGAFEKWQNEEIQKELDEPLIER